MSFLRSLTVPAILFVTLVGCGGSSSKSGSGGISGGAGGTSGNDNLNCAVSGSSMGACTSAEYAPYSACLMTACDSQFKTCFGAGYKTGSFSGACGPYITCTSKCACNDTACSSACISKLDSTCTGCLLGSVSCSGSCTEPACASEPGTGTGGTSGLGGFPGGLGGFFGGFGGNSGALGTCADLLACCNRANATYKPTCMMAYTQSVAGGGASADLVCGEVLAGTKVLFCP